VYDLHDRLSRKRCVSPSPLPSLPSRKLFGSSVADDFVQQRSNSLQAYFQSLCALPLITLDDDFCAFLKIVAPMAATATPLQRAKAVLTKVTYKRVVWFVMCDM